MVCRTAFAHVRRSSLRVRTVMEDLDRGVRVAELDQAGVHLDLD